MHRTAPHRDAYAVADMLFQRAIGLGQISTDRGLALAIVDACENEHHPAGRCSADYDAIRLEMRLLWGEAELQGRREECSRYAMPATRVQ